MNVDEFRAKYEVKSKLPVTHDELIKTIERRLQWAVRHQVNRATVLINGVPSGDKRNKLTEANIHLMSAQKALEEASKL